VLTALAALSDLEDRQPGGVPTADETRALRLLEDASAIVRAVAGKTWTDDTGALTEVPDIIVTVVCASARRALNNPEGAISETDGTWSQTLAQASADPFLTDTEIRLVRQAANTGGGLWTLPTTRDPEGIGTEMPSVLAYGPGGSVYLTTDPPGEPLDWGGSVG
jgi:hypothetical protein